MVYAAADFLKILIFLCLGFSFRTFGLFNNNEIEGIKKIVLYIAIPLVLFLSFSRLEFNLSLLPISLAVFTINLSLFWLGFLIYKLTGSKYRLLPLIFSTMNFGHIGLPLFEAVYGIENLQHYTMFGVGSEFYMWFVFFFMYKWFLTGGKVGKKIDFGFVKSPVIWGIILGCAFSILGIDIFASHNVFILGISKTISSASKLTTPLILIFVGFNISLSSHHIKKSFKYLILRLFSAFVIGYLLKITVLDHYISDSIYYDSAYFLLLSLPPVFSLPILAAEYLETEELKLLNNIIVLHVVVTISLFAMFTLTFAK